MDEPAVLNLINMTMIETDRDIYILKPDLPPWVSVTKYIRSSEEIFLKTMIVHPLLSLVVDKFWSLIFFIKEIPFFQPFLYYNTRMCLISGFKKNSFMVCNWSAHGERGFFYQQYLSNNWIGEKIKDFKFEFNRKSSNTRQLFEKYDHWKLWNDCFA